MDVTEEVRQKVIERCLEYLRTDGEHHKQYALEKILKLMRPDIEQMWNVSWDEGIA